MIDKDNPHTERQNGYMISYFKDQVAVGKNDEWDKCFFEVWGWNGPIKIIDFVKKKQVDQMRYFLDRIYQIGKYDAKEEIRKVLGVKE